MLLSHHDKNLNLKPFDVIELQGYIKNQINGKYLIVLSRPPIVKTSCTESIWKNTKEWSEGCDIAAMMEGISLDVPCYPSQQPKNLQKVQVLSMDTVKIGNRKDLQMENPEEDIMESPFIETN